MNTEHRLRCGTILCHAYLLNALIHQDLLDVISNHIFPSGMLNEVADLSEHCKTMCKKLGGKEVPEELIRYIT